MLMVASVRALMMPEVPGKPHAGLEANCGHRGQRPQLEWRLGRLVVVSDAGCRYFLSLGVLTPVAAPNVFLAGHSIRISVF
jgi:hypothetical protein